MQLHTQARMHTHMHTHTPQHPPTHQVQHVLHPAAQHGDQQVHLSQKGAQVVLAGMARQPGTGRQLRQGQQAQAWEAGVSSSQGLGLNWRVNPVHWQPM